MNARIQVLVVLVLALASVKLQGQSAGNGPTPEPTPKRVVERGQNHRVWQWETYQTSPTGKSTPQVHQITELAGGLHFWQENQWVDSVEQINPLTDGGAAAVMGPHQAYFPGDIFNGVIEVVTAEGLDLKSRPAGLTYDDGNRTVLIAALTNSVGELVGSNQVIYPNAFSGLAADLVLTYRKGGFESEVVFREQLPDPNAVYGLAAAQVRLQLLTEFFDSPEPGQIISDADEVDGLTDTTLSFGSLKMVRGKAFTSGNQGGQTPGGRAVRVYKSWLSVAARHFLVEAVPYQRIAPQLQTLPLHAGMAPLEPKHFAADWLPAYRRAQVTTNKIELAKSDRLRRPGVVLDYVAVNTVQTNFTFRADATYYISSGISFAAKTVFQGGTVIKYGVAGSILISGSYQCQTGPYREAIFTSMNDDTVGESISGSSGSPGMADSSNDLDIGTTGGQLNYLRFSYTSGGATQQGLDVWDCQFVNCGGAGLVELGSVAKLHNVLFAKCRPGYAIIQNTANPLTVVGENITADQCAGLFNPTNTGYLTNCLFTGLGTALPSAATNNPTVVIRSTNTGVYQIAGAGSYYLSTNSPARNAGTTGITPALLTELRQKTTTPPLVYSNTTLSASQTFGPRAPRDTNAAPDAGFHYDVLDYAFGDVSVTANVTFTAGTAVGWFEADGAMTGLFLNDGASLSFDGTARAPCDFARYNAVQEGGNGFWKDRGYLGGVVFNGSDPAHPPQLTASSTRWQIPAGGPNQFLDYYAAGLAGLRDCEFYGGNIVTYAPSYYFTNCLFYAVCVAFWDQNDAANLAFQNCTFYNGGLALCRNFGQSPSFWTIRNTAFDGTALIALDDNHGDTNYMAFDYNTHSSSNLTWQAYDFGIGVPSTNKLEVGGSHDFMVTNYNWQTGLLGDFYLSPDSPLTNNGSGNAADLAIGLDNATTQTNQAPDMGRVDIGYHYPISGYIREGLLAYWKLDDGYGSIARDSIGTNNLILTNSPIWGNGCLTFNGSNQFCYASDSAALDITGEITICAWINSASFSATDYQVPVEKGLDASDEGYFIRLSSSTLEGGSWSRSGDPQKVSVTNYNETGKWYFVTAVYHNGFWFMYRNGIYVDSHGVLYGPLSTTAPLYVGAASINYSGFPPITRFFHGSIRDVGIYNRALNAGEIEANFLNTETNSSVAFPDLLYLKMLEGATDAVTSTSTILLNMMDSSTIGHTNVILSYPHTREWITNIASIENSALHFNGTAVYIDTHDTNNFNFTTNHFTVNFWALALDAGEYFFQNGGTTNGWYISEDSSRDVIFGSASPADSHIVTLSSGVSPSLWKMVTCVWDGTNAFIYINGKQVAVAGSFNTPASSSSSLIIGIDPTISIFYDGDMWLPQIWSSALTAADIANLYFKQDEGRLWP